MAGAEEDIAERNLGYFNSMTSCKMSFYFFVKHLRDAALGILLHVPFCSIQTERNITFFFFNFFFPICYQLKE